MQDWSAIKRANEAVFRCLGLQIEGPLPEKAGEVPTLALVVQTDMVNASNLCHGGILYALADTACAWTLHALEQSPATVDASMTYLRAAELGEKVIAHPLLLKRGRRTSTCTVDLLGRDDRLLATFRGTCVDLSS